MNDENFKVAQMGARWKRAPKRKLRIEKCRNGYFVRFEVFWKADRPSFETECYTIEEAALFHDRKKMLDFLDDYFGDGK